MSVPWLWEMGQAGCTASLFLRVAEALGVTLTTACPGGHCNSMSPSFCWEITQRSGVCSDSGEGGCLCHKISGPVYHDSSPAPEEGARAAVLPLTPENSNAAVARQVFSEGKTQTNPVYMVSSRTSRPTQPSAPTAGPQDLLWHISRRAEPQCLQPVRAVTANVQNKIIIQDSSQSLLLSKTEFTVLYPKGAGGHAPLSAQCSDTTTTTTTPPNTY